MSQPQSYKDWFGVALERANDASAMTEGRQKPSAVGPVYIAGYAVECALKGYLQRNGIPFSSSGAEGHDLRALWKSTDFKFSDLPGREGRGTFFITRWTTDMRYETLQDSGHSTGDLVKAAKRLSFFIRKKARRGRGR